MALYDYFLIHPFGVGPRTLVVVYTGLVGGGNLNLDGEVTIGSPVDGTVCRFVIDTNTTETMWQLIASNHVDDPVNGWKRPLDYADGQNQKVWKRLLSFGTGGGGGGGGTIPYNSTYSVIARVDPGGDDSTGVAGDYGLPFKTVAAAIAALEALPGVAFRYIDVGATFFDENITTSLTALGIIGRDNENAGVRSVTFTETTNPVEVTVSSAFCDSLTFATTENIEIDPLGGAYVGDVTAMNTLGVVIGGGAFIGGQCNNVTTGGGFIQLAGLCWSGTLKAVGGDIWIYNSITGAIDYSTFAGVPNVDSAGSNVVVNFGLVTITHCANLTLNDARTTGGTSGATGTVTYNDVLLAGGDVEGISGITPLMVGQSYVDVVFATPQPDVNWTFVECRVVNTVDASPLNLWTGTGTVKTTTGFRVLLNADPDSGNYYLAWTIRTGIVILASTYSLSGPTTGGVGIPSTNFTVALPSGTGVASSVIVTPSDGGGGGTFTPSTVTLTTTTPFATFTYTPASTGAKTISVTNDGGLIDPTNLTYTVGAPVLVLDDSHYTTTSFDNLSGAAGNTGIGQAYVSTGGTLDHSRLFCAKLGSPPGNIISRIYSTISGAVDTLLATSDPVLASSIVDFTQNSFPFSGANRIHLVAGTKYAVTFEYSDGDASNGVYFYFTAGNTHPGNMVNRFGSPLTSPWAGNDTSIYDSNFEVWVYQ